MFHRQVVTPSCKLNHCSTQLCRECFYEALEHEVHQTIIANALFQPGERVAVAASGVHATGYRVPVFCQCIC
jgi:hypothetical protein